MALAVTVNYTVTDAKGKSSLCKIRVPSGFSLNQYGEFAVAMGQLVANICDGAITDISVGIPVNLSAATIRASALGIADIAKKALFMMSSAVVGLFSKVFVPTYNEANTTTGSDEINAADADIAAYVAVLEAGITTGGETVTPIDVRGNDLTDVGEMREIFRKFG
jgi:hypothetical protein